MDTDDAFSLSDSYIQKCELIHSPDRIINLQYHLILDFTERVENLRHGSNPSKLVLDVENYVRHHLSETISVNEIAKALYLSRPYLSRKFKEESGTSLSDFILQEKMKEAKRLLRYSDKSVAAIGVYLGYSSQSHFSKVFKAGTGLAPGKYREKYVTLLAP
jgi:AraC-like DNA-binding protein